MTEKKKKEGVGTTISTFPKCSRQLCCFILIMFLACSIYTTNAQTCNAGTYDTGSGYCSPCQVDRRCSGGTSNIACSSNQYAPTRSNSCTSFTYGTKLAGKLFDCAPNAYRSTQNVCTTCQSGYSCNSNSRSACSSSATNYELSEDGKCYSCPDGTTCSNRNMDNASPVNPGSYLSSNNAYACGTDYKCINGVRTTCPTGTWAGTSYTNCNYCPPNHICNWNPTSCGNGLYMASLSATSCSTCTAGYFCKKDWVDRIKVYPGTYAGTGATTATECPIDKSCTATGVANCGSYTYSGPGGVNCEDAPTFLKFLSSVNRYEAGTTNLAQGTKFNAGNDDSQTNCGTTNYCPGIDGLFYSVYSGLNINGASIIAKPAGDSCTTTYSNGGTDCQTCSPGVSDRSKCVNEADVNIVTQFAESYYNSNNEREGVAVTCLDSSDDRDVYGTVTGESGNLGEDCDIEGSGAGVYPPNSCEGIRDESNIAIKLGGLKVRHTTSHYRQCSWCPDDLNCEYHNSYFSFFNGFLMKCPYGEYSANGDLECHRKAADTYCKTGYYRTIHSTDKDDQWIHDQDKRYECISINQSPSTNYVAVDSTQSPDCEVGDWVRYGLEGCQANSPGFYNDANTYSESSSKCNDGFFCRPDRIKDELKTSQFSCPEGSVGMTDGARSEHLQCDLCRPGKYCQEGSTISTQVDCPQGYFCPAGTSDKLQSTCGAGFYGAGTGGKHFSDTCTMCSAAKYCEQSSTSETTCPNGYY